MTTEDAPQQRLFRTFQGVFRPTFLTLLGAMFYLREGWLVGSTGLAGALLIIVAAHVITGATAMSLSSISTNTRVKPGGAFAIIANALGLEAGGAIAVPLFVAQSASSALYLYAFSEVWAFIFPHHDPHVVVGVAFLAVATLALTSAEAAFRAQAAMLVVVACAVLSAFGGFFVNDWAQPRAFVRGSGVTLMTGFSIFFPAVTGVMVGVGMSGSLADPRKSIPVGTLAAWGTAFAIYAGGAFLYAILGSPVELISNKTILFERAAIGPLVVMGVLASTLMAALSSLIAAPRLLHAMARHDAVPLAGWLGQTTAGGDPRNATLFTLLLSAIALSSGSLDAIAPIITSFFLVTYLAVNGVVVMEQQLGMISFRPTFQVAPWIPITGLVASFAALVLTSAGGGMVEMMVVGGVYAWLHSRHLRTPWETTRSGIGITLAAWVARRFGQRERNERAWRPDLCVIVEAPDSLDRLLPVVRGLTHQSGSAVLVGLGQAEGLDDALTHAKNGLVGRGLYARWIHLGAVSGVTGTNLALDALQGALFPPNLVLVDGTDPGIDLRALTRLCAAQRRGLAVFFPHPGGQALEHARRVQVWVSDRSPDWTIGLHLANLDLPVLTGFLVSRWHGGALRMVTAVRELAHVEPARRFLGELVEAGRLPPDTGRVVLDGSIYDALRDAPPADLHVFGLATDPDPERLRALHQAAGGASIFVLDSGRESLLA